MKHIETPEKRWGKREYPYHQTGEVSEAEYLNRLNPFDHSNLIILLLHLQSVARSMRTPLHALAVGSSADILWPEYRDIDLLICPEKPALRSYFVAEAYKEIKPDPNFIVERNSPKGSVPILNTHHEPYTPFKLVAFPVGPMGLAKYAKQFDITFVGENGESFADVLQFHRSNNLAFAQLT